MSISSGGIECSRCVMGLCGYRIATLFVLQLKRSRRIANEENSRHNLERIRP